MSKLVKFSGQMDGRVKAELEAFAKQSGQKLSRIYSEMAEAYLRTRKVRPEVMRAADEFIRKNADLLNRLAK